MSGPLLVTAAGGSFFSLLQSLIASLRVQALFPSIPLAVVDVGLTAFQRQMLIGEGIQLAYPKLPAWWTSPPTKNGSAVAQLCRPHYPQIFPSADLIIHIDADIWFATAESVQLALRYAAAGSADVVAAAHDHPSYQADPSTLKWRRDMAGHYTHDLLTRWDTSANIYVNSGLVAARSTSPIWAHWADVFDRAPRQNVSLVNDQAALNNAIQEHRMTVAWLPPSANWLVHLAVPAFDPITGCLVDPSAANQTISGLHLTGRDKLAVHALPILGGGTLLTPLDRKSFLRERDRYLAESDPKAL